MDMGPILFAKVKNMKSKALVNRKKVLAVGMVDSVHFARWLEAVSGLPADFTIFPSGPNRKIHPIIEKLTSSETDAFFLSKTLACLSLPIWVLDRLFSSRIRAFALWVTLGLKAYEIVHFHEMQSGGYPLSRLPAISLSKSKVFYTPYGSDLFWYQHHARHVPRIRKTLKVVNGIFPECARDGELARKFGFEGDVYSAIPAAGPFQFQKRHLPAISSRSKITVKGYGGKWGRAIEVLRSLERVQDGLTGYEIHVTSVTSDVDKEITRLQSTSKLNLVAHPKFSLSREEILSLLSESKFHLALSTSDGFPASLFESLMCEAIPIQSDTSCLHASLVEIAPNNFVSTQDWDKVGQIVLDLHADSEQLDALSEAFVKWAEGQVITSDVFHRMIANAYCLTGE